jgi:type VI secretion system secreted protein VgrG
MPGYSQQDRPLILTTPLGKDVLLVTSFQGHESISQLFDFEMEMLAERETKIPFDQILGQTVTLEMRLLNGDKRYFNALVKQFREGRRDEVFVYYRASLTPKLWLLTKKVRSRIFQHITVPDILKVVLTGMDVTYELAATYFPRDYCVQYGESDFDFASRLMEEEGIYYFFKHSDGSHQMVVTDLPGKHPTVPGQSHVIYEEVIGEDRTDMRVTGWEKTQTIRSGEFTAWDYCFELPDKNLEAIEKTIPIVTVGKVTHKLQVGGNDQLEIYEYPGGYAQRFDGISQAGAPQPLDLNNIFPDRTRTVRIRMEQEEVQSIDIQGNSDCGHFTAGHEFTLERHFDADDKYLLTRVEHAAKQGDYRSEQTGPFTYENRFSSIPDGLHYRPQQTIRKPVIAGLQTAVVTGPKGEEIFVDKYGRVKVQFHWDREGKLNADSSCWVRVAQVWAGKGWGAFFWPRIGHEVVVIFEEGDPDKPLIVGSVYNHDNMPWYMLPKNKQLGGIKSASESGTAHQNYNGIVFNDEKGKEHLSIHSEHNLSLNSEKNKMIHSGASKGERVGVASMLTVGKIVPVTGGSGGAGFDEGNPVPDPPPAGITGLNSTVTYGDQFQLANPVSHQVTIGQNLQMCISTGSLLGEAKGLLSSPLVIAAGVAQAIAGGMGAMQFTIGSSAQFTLGQSFEISVGPPKIEIHKSHSKKWDPVRILCVLLGTFTEVFSFTYDLLKGSNEVKKYTNARTKAEKAAALASEESGDRERADLVLAFQALTDVMLVATLLAEYLTDTPDWYGSDIAKQAYEKSPGSFGLWKATTIADGPVTKPGDDGSIVTGSNWSGAGQIALGVAGVVLMVLAELTALDIPPIIHGDSAESQ